MGSLMSTDLLVNIMMLMAVAFQNKITITMTNIAMAHHRWKITGVRKQYNDKYCNGLSGGRKRKKRRTKSIEQVASYLQR